MSSYERLMERHERQCSTFITKKHQHRQLEANSTAIQGKHWVTGWGSIKHIQPVYTIHFWALIVLMLLFSSAGWKWRMSHQSSPLIPIHYRIRPTPLILNCTADENSCLSEAEFHKPAVRLFIPLWWPGWALHLLSGHSLQHISSWAVALRHSIFL